MIRALVTALTLTAASASADIPPEVAQNLSQPALIGQTTTRVLGFALYDAELFTSGGASYDRSAPFALTLTYRRSFQGDKLAEATIDEIARIENLGVESLRSLQSELQSCFRNVSPGERVTAFGPASNRVDVYVNGARTCRLQEPGIKTRFFNIWLSNASRDPSGAAALRGQR